MSKVIIFMNLTLDGIMQAPGRPDEDRRGGFEHGGWAAPYAAMTSSEAGESISNIDALLMGRRTYEDFYAYWPKQTDNPFTEVLNSKGKGLRCDGQRQAHPDTHEAQPRRSVRAPDPPARSGIGSSSLH